MVDWLRTQGLTFPLSLFQFEILAFIGIGSVLYFLARTFPISWEMAFAQFERWVIRLFNGAYAPTLLRSYALVLIISLGTCWLLGSLRPPLPLVHDEFAYLLGADTFAHGRLANPPHPMWPHFESNHILNQPSYAPKYPPGQALFLAAGQVLLGDPAWGLWLGYVAAMTVLFWLLNRCLPHPWALLGAILTALNGKILKVWALGFMGGTVAFLGGALVFGSLLGLWTRWRTSDAIAFALGSVILLVSRPYEGIVALLPAGIIFLMAFYRQATSLFDWFAKALPPILVLAVGIAWIGLYNYRVTGSVRTLPYEVYGQTYELTRSFVFQAPRRDFPSAALRHPTHYSFIKGEAATHAFRRTTRGFLLGIQEKITVFGRFYIGFAWLLPLIIFLLTVKSFQERFVLSTVTLVLLATFVCTFEHPHYLAPVGSLIVLMMISGLQKLYKRLSGQLWIRQVLVATIILVHLSETVVASIKYVTVTPTLPNYKAILSQLSARLEPKHLVVVKYGSSTNHNEEWVYNRAEIDSAAVVWAHDMGPHRNRTLLRYFQKRKIWLFEPDTPAGQRLTPLN